MKSILIIFLLLICFSFQVSSDNKPESGIIELQFSEKSFAFSRIAKPGKVSVFILSTSWCNPCLNLKNSFLEAFEHHLFKKKDLEVFYCPLSSTKYNSFESLNKNKGYINFKEIDQLTSVFPTTYILTPTTNCYTIISGNYPDSIFHIISDLIKRKNKFFSIKNLDIEMYASSKQDDIEKDDIIDSLQKEIFKLKTTLRKSRIRASNK